jgi:hypothetical protein
MKKYFINQNGFTYGPYSFEELRMMNIYPLTPVWFQGMRNWIPANQVGELQSLFYTNPQPYYQQPAPYTPPVSQTPSDFSQTTSSTNPIPNTSNKKLFIILGSVLVFLIAFVIFAFYSYQEKRKRQVERERELMDSIVMADSISKVMVMLEADSTRKADSAAQVKAMMAALGSSEYAGMYSDNTGGKLVIQGNSNNDLEIKLSFQSPSDDYCYGEVDGTGSVSSDNKIIMTTTDGYRIVLDITGTIISVKESKSCKSNHSVCFSYDGFYFKQ